MRASTPGPAGLKDMRRSNELTVLEELYTTSTTTRTALAQAIGVTKPTVSAALATLVGVGLAERVPESEGGSKYGAEQFRAAGRTLPILGIDVGTKYIRVQLAGLDDRLLAEAEEEISDPDVNGMIGAILRLREGVCAVAGVSADSIQSAGIGIPGVARPHEAHVVMAGGVAGLEGFDLAGRLGRALGGVPVLVENDVNTAAIAENRYGAVRGIDDFAMVSVGAGVGAALVLDGRLRHGRRGSAGEVDVLFDRSRGTLLDDPAAEAMTAYAEAALGRSRTEPVRLPQVFEAAASGDPAARRVVDEAARRIAEVCASVVAVVDVDTIVLVGGIGAAIAPGMTALMGRLDELLPWPTKVVQSALGRSGNVMGARYLAVDATRRRLFEENIGKTLYKTS